MNGRTTQKMKCASKRTECRFGVSLLFVPADGGKLFDYAPGQFVRILAPGMAEAKPYVISQGPGSGAVRVTVWASSDGVLPALAQLKPGDSVEMTLPEGDFTPDIKAEHPIVLLGEDAGIAPMVSMLETLAVENPLRVVHAMYATNSSETFALREAYELALNGMPNAAGAVFFKAPLGTDRQGAAFDAEGDIEAERLRNFCQDPDADFYLAGPAAMVDRLRAELTHLGVIHARIHTLVLE